MMEQNGAVKINFKSLKKHGLKIKQSLWEEFYPYIDLREKYEFRRQDDAGKFFIREIELKRKYEVHYNDLENSKESKQEIKKNCELRRKSFH